MLLKYTYSAWLNQFDEEAPEATVKESLPVDMTPVYEYVSPGVYHFKVKRNDEDVLTNALPFINQTFTGFPTRHSTRALDGGVYIYVEKLVGGEYVAMDGEMGADTSFKVEFWIEE